jgi:hypothetical protein
MMRREKFAIANIYVPVKRRATATPVEADPLRLSLEKAVGIPDAIHDY